MLDPSGRIATLESRRPALQGLHGRRDHRAALLASSSRRRIGRPASRTSPARQPLAEGRFEAEGWRVRKDGTRFWANAVLDPILDPDGEHVGFAKITRDITAKREQERALFESEQRFRLLVQGVRDYAIYMLDTEGHVTNWNSGAREHQGLHGRRDRRPAFLPLLHRRGPRTRRAAVRARDRAPRRQVRTRGAGASARTAPCSGPASSSTRSSTRTASMSASPRSRATSPSGKRLRMSWKKRATRCSSRRSSRRSAS